MRLRVRDICFAYDGHVALTEASFTLPPGKILCAMGPNGAGKSTLLKCLNRILNPQSGKVELDDEDVGAMDLQTLAKHFGYVPQRHPLTRLSVFETILLGRKPHMDWRFGPSDYEIVEKVILKLGLSNLAMRSIGNLSGGELQKVILARALAQEPSVLLLDEPTSNLDLKNQLEVVDLLRNIVDETSLTALVAIHDLNIALRFADTFLFLKESKIHSIIDKGELTEKTLEEVYGLRVQLHKIGERQVIIPL